MILADETFINLTEEELYIIPIATATSVLPRIAWGLMLSYLLLLCNEALELNNEASGALDNSSAQDNTFDVLVNEKELKLHYNMKKY